MDVATERRLTREFFRRQAVRAFAREEAYRNCQPAYEPTPQEIAEACRKIREQRDAEHRLCGEDEEACIAIWHRPKTYLRQERTVPGPDRFRRFGVSDQDQGLEHVVRQLEDTLADVDPWYISDDGPKTL